MNKKTLLERAAAPTPKMFKKVRGIGIALTGAGTAMLALPFELSANINSAGEMMMVGGIVMGIVAQMVTTEASE